MPATDALLTEWQSAASYTLDQPVRCPHCRERINSVRIVGLTRSQVAFTSMLPRKGRVIVCPDCERILTAELSGLV
jgi:DNA-directed RNA polymerase subunit RPC12/RpoP